MSNDPASMTLMRAAMQAEFDLAHAPLLRRIHLLRRTLKGMAANATQCGACQMTNDIAAHAIRRDDNGGVCNEPGCWCVGPVENGVKKVAKQGRS